MEDKNYKNFDSIEDIPAKTPELEEIPAKSHKLLLRIIAVAAAVAFIVGIFSFLPRRGEKAMALTEPEYPKMIDEEDIDGQMERFEANPIEPEFIDGVKEFSYETASEVLGDSKANQNFSPLSLYYALAISANGAEGETQKELFELLNVDNAEYLLKQAGNMYRMTYNVNDLGSLKIANSLWIQEGFNCKQDFLDGASKDLYSSVYAVDFQSDSASKQMSKWIEDNTNGSLTPEISVSPDKLLSIINTIYFKDQWVDRFDKNKTKPDVFHTAAGEDVNCDFMNAHYASAGFSTGEGFTRAYLSLKNSGSMVFILPDEGVSVESLVKDSEKLKEAFEGGESHVGEVIWQIPKFNFGSSFDLRESLETLGVKSAFSPDADFSGITDQQLFMSGVRQDSHIAIDEIGVEASSFTQIDYCGACMPEGRAEMILTRPFIFGISDRNGLLFMGICNNPLES